MSFLRPLPVPWNGFLQLAASDAKLASRFRYRRLYFFICFAASPIIPPRSTRATSSTWARPSASAAACWLARSPVSCTACFHGSASPGKRHHPRLASPHGDPSRRASGAHRAHLGRRGGRLNPLFLFVGLLAATFRPRPASTRRSSSAAPPTGNLASFQAAGGTGDFQLYTPPQGLTGHRIGSAPSLWSATLEAYLADQGLPTRTPYCLQLGLSASRCSSSCQNEGGSPMHTPSGSPFRTSLQRCYPATDRSNRRTTLSNSSVA